MCDIGDILGLSSDIIFPSYANIGLHKLQVNMERIAQLGDQVSSTLSQDSTLQSMKGRPAALGDFDRFLVIVNV